MSQVEVLDVALRAEEGKRNSRRLRDAGKIPAVLYGHGQESVSLSLSKDQVWGAIRHHSRLVELKGAVTDTALMKSVQWDTFGVNVLHLDLIRVSRSEKVEISVPVELRGEAAGHKAGGVVELVVHELTILCPVISIPEKLVVNVTNLQLDGSIDASAVPLPEGASLVSEPDMMVVHCVAAKTEEELAAAAAGEGEPEIIGKKAGEEAAEAE